ncbi:kinase-like domain-containing protein, partial [Pavlovales sp. CCMP2436]
VFAGGKSKLADFGLAAIAQTVGWRSSAESTTGAQGTAAYMAPEIVRGESRLSSAADVFAAGILLAELLSGEPPLSHLANQHPFTLNFAIASGQRPTIWQGTPELRALISRAWAGDAVARPEAAVLHLELRSMAADGVGGDVLLRRRRRVKPAPQAAAARRLLLHRRRRRRRATRLPLQRLCRIIERAGRRDRSV